MYVCKSFYIQHNYRIITVGLWILMLIKLPTSPHILVYLIGLGFFNFVVIITVNVLAFYKYNLDLFFSRNRNSILQMWYNYTLFVFRLTNISILVVRVLLKYTHIIILYAIVVLILSLLLQQNMLQRVGTILLCSFYMEGKQFFTHEIISWEKTRYFLNT